MITKAALLEDLDRAGTAASRTSAPPRRQAENGLCGIM